MRVFVETSTPFAPIQSKGLYLTLPQFSPLYVFRFCICFRLIVFQHSPSCIYLRFRANRKQKSCLSFFERASHNIIDPLTGIVFASRSLINDPDPVCDPFIIMNNRLHSGCIFWQPADFSAHSEGVIQPSAKWGRLWL